MNKNHSMNRTDTNRKSSSYHGRSLNSSRSQATSISKASHIAASRKRKQSANKIKKTLIVLACVILFGGIFHVVEGKLTNTSVVYAEEHLSDLQYKIIEIAYGDTLWSIAKENMTPGFHDINEYIDEIKECNQLTTDDINYGGYLMIPYYEYLNIDAVNVSKN